MRSSFKSCRNLILPVRQNGSCTDSNWIPTLKILRNDGQRAPVRYLDGLLQKATAIQQASMNNGKISFMIFFKLMVKDVVHHILCIHKPTTPSAASRRSIMLSETSSWLNSMNLSAFAIDSCLPLRFLNFMTLAFFALVLLPQMFARIIHDG